MIDIQDLNMSKAQLARLLNVSRTYVTLLSQAKRKPSQELVDKLSQLAVDASGSKPVDTLNPDTRLQIRRGALIMSSVGSTPMRSRQLPQFPVILLIRW